MRRSGVATSAALVLLTGALILFIGGGARFAIGLTLKPMQADLSGGRSQIGSAVALFQIVSALAMFAAGRLADRVDLARVLAGGLLVGGVGLGAIFLVDASWQVLVLYGLIFAIGNGVASLIPVGVLVTRRFPDQTGLANAIVLTGMGVGQLVMMASLAAVLDDIGWRQVYLWLGLVHLLAVPLVLFAIAGPAPDTVKKPAGNVAAGVSPQAPATGLSVREAARTRRFWLLLVIYSLCGLEDFFVSTHIVAFAQDRGAGTMAAGSLLALMGLMALAGVLISGALSDRVGPVRATFAAFAIRIVIFAAVLVDQSPWTVAAFALLFGATFLVTAPLTVIFVRDAFGSRNLGALTGMITMVHHIFGGLGAIGGAAAFDAQGSYDTALAWMLVTSVAGALLSLALSRTASTPVPR